MRTAIRGFLPPVLTPRTATLIQLDPSPAVTALSKTSARVLTSVREQVSTVGWGALFPGCDRDSAVVLCLAEGR